MKDKVLIWLGVGYIASLLLNLVQIKHITGIPAHPLLLHMPVIFIPSLALAAIVFAIRADWRKRFGIAYAIGAIVTTAATTLTTNAGEAWQHMLDQHDQAAIHDHAELGDKLHVLVIVFAGLVLLQVAIDRGGIPAIKDKFADSRGGLAVALSILIGIVAAGSAVLTVITGHEGAKAVFKQGGDFNRGEFPRGGPPNGGFGSSRPDGQQYYPPKTN